MDCDRPVSGLASEPEGSNRAFPCVSTVAVMRSLTRLPLRGQRRNSWPIGHNAPTSLFHPLDAQRQGHLLQGAKGREFGFGRQTGIALGREMEVPSSEKKKQRVAINLNSDHIQPSTA